MKTYRTLLIALLSWVALAPPTRAQFLCTITEGEHIGRNIYFGYTSLTCSGNNCMVAVRTVPDTAIYGFGHTVFLRSVDGGQTWSEQDPGISDTTVGIVGIELIDSSNIIAFGNSSVPPYGLFVRTRDGGSTWQQEPLPTKYGVADIDFSNDTDGIFIAGDGTFSTSDGGGHWNIIPFFRNTETHCHAYGHGKYRLFDYWSGTIYTTMDNWNTVDSTGPIVSLSGPPHHYYFDNCSFGTGDTILVSGDHDTSPYIARTTDGGHHWSSVYDDPAGPSGYVAALSDVNRDTILAGLTGTQNIILWSTDHGATWVVDSLLFNDTNFKVSQNDGIGINSKGNVVGAFDFFIPPNAVTSFSLIIGRRATSSGVISNDFSSKSLFYPNPAVTSITLTCDVADGTLHLLDLLGRETLRVRLNAGGDVTLDVSQLPRGIYEVMIERNGQMVPAGKLALIGR